MSKLVTWLTAIRPWRTLGGRLMLISLLVEITMLTALVVSNTRTMERAMGGQFDTRMTELTDLLESALATPLVQRDYGTLQDLLDALCSDEGIEYMVLFDRHGQMMASSGWPEGKTLPPLSSGRGSDADDRYDTRVSIRLGGQSYGELRLGLSTRIFAETRRSLVGIGFIIAATEVILSATLLFAVGLWVTRRLAKVTQASYGIAQGDLNSRVPIDPAMGDDEINQMARTFNTMADNLQLRMTQIADSEAQLRVLFTEAVTAQENLSKHAAALERSNAELEQFAYVASHDLREPLRMVSSFLSLLERRYAPQLDQDAREYIAFAREGATRLDRLVLDLLDFSRIGRSDARMDRLDSRVLLTQAIDNLGAAIEESGAKITIPDHMPPIWANEHEVVRLFQNLIGNAIKFHAPNRPAEISVTCEAQGDEWLFAVADNGIGISPEFFDKLFRIFQRLNTRDRYDGNGIGLAICKRIVERCGGRIWVNSQLGQGATFSFTMPVCPTE